MRPARGGTGAHRAAYTPGPTAREEGPGGAGGSRFPEADEEDQSGCRSGAGTSPEPPPGPSPEPAAGPAPTLRILDTRVMRGPTTGPASPSSARSWTWGSSRSGPATRSPGSWTRSLSCCRRWRTTPARSAGAAASSPGCGTAPGPATWRSTSRSSSRTWRGPTSVTARPAARASTAGTTSSTSTARNRWAGRRAAWPWVSSTTSWRPRIRTTPSTRSRSSRS